MVANVAGAVQSSKFQRYEGRHCAPPRKRQVMRILMSGFTTRMGGDASKIFYLSTSFLLAEILFKHLGHEVEHRKIMPGET